MLLLASQKSHLDFLATQKLQIEFLRDLSWGSVAVHPFWRVLGS